MRIAASPLWGAVLCAALIAALAGAQPRKKQVKDQGEQELYNRAIHAEDPIGQLQALEAWAAQYPESEFKDDRLYFCMQAYSKANPPQPAKVVEYGGLLMSRGLGAVFTGPEGGFVILNVLFLVARNAAAMTEASPQQVALGQKAAHDLLQFLTAYKPPNTSETEWATARADIEQRTRETMIALALSPGNQAMAKTPPDCAVAAALYTDAVRAFPESAPVSYWLAKAQACEGRMPQAIYQFLRAAAQDPSIAPGYADSLYTAYHGGTDGLDAVRALAKTTPLAPPDFEIETAAQVAAHRQGEFELRNPHLARWNALRERLTATYGPQYFDGQVKGEPISLKGVVVEGRPSCRPKELLVGTGPGASPEVAIRLDTPLAGAAVPGEIEFTAVPRAYSKDPFLITMDADRAKVVNLKIGPCPQP